MIDDKETEIHNDVNTTKKENALPQNTNRSQVRVFTRHDLSKSTQNGDWRQELEHVRHFLLQPDPHELAEMSSPQHSLYQSTPNLKEVSLNLPWQIKDKNNKKPFSLQLENFKKVADGDHSQESTPEEENERTSLGYQPFSMLSHSRTHSTDNLNNTDKCLLHATKTKAKRSRRSTERLWSSASTESLEVRTVENQIQGLGPIKPYKRQAHYGGTKIHLDVKSIDVAEEICVCNEPGKRSMEIVKPYSDKHQLFHTNPSVSAERLKFNPLLKKTPFKPSVASKSLDSVREQASGKSVTTKTSDSFKQQTSVNPSLTTKTSDPVKHQTSGKPSLTTQRSDPVKHQTSGKPSLTTQRSDSVKLQTSGKPSLTTKTSDSVKHQTSVNPSLTTKTSDPLKYQTSVKPSLTTNTSESVKQRTSDTSDSVKQHTSVKSSLDIRTSDSVRQQVTKTSKSTKQQTSVKPSLASKTSNSVKQQTEFRNMYVDEQIKKGRRGRQHNPNSQTSSIEGQEKHNHGNFMPKTADDITVGIKTPEFKRTPLKNRAKNKITKSLNPSQCCKHSERKIMSLYIRVHKAINDITKLESVLRAKVNLKDVNLVPTEISTMPEFTLCTLTLPSKSLAQKVKMLLHKDRTKFTPLIDCSLTNFDHEKFLQNRLEQRKHLQQHTLHEIEVQSDLLLRNHEEKLVDTEEKLHMAKQNLRDVHKENEAIKEIEALEEKQLELEKQKEEYEHSIHGFKTKLLVLVEKETFDNEIKILQKQVGIECCRLRKPLPIYARRQEIVNLVQNNQVSIILGETGSGKSTQMVQYLMEAGFSENGLIVCTQPRKVAAISLATQVAKELATNVGREVGYKVGTKTKCSDKTKIVFMTDHCLLNDCLKDPSFTKFSCVVVDEAHERSLHTDLLLGMIKRCLPQRPELRVVITSATIDPQVFIDFFQHSCARTVMKVSGRTFPVEVIWQDEENEEGIKEDFVNEAISKAIEIHTTKPEGDILVFLTSPLETENSCNLFQEKMKDVKGDFKCFPLHGQLLPAEQQKVFEPLGRHMRKIVFATNCAETSITIDGIKYVVDTGMVKEMRYDAKRNMNTLTVTVISKSSAEQRKGRAGRTAPGKCYRLFSEKTFNSMDTISQPEILRTHLGSALLKLAELGIGPDMYDFVQSPCKEAITAALETLVLLGAMENGKITEIGQWIAKLPFDPKLGRLTLLGKDNDVLYDSIVLASVMSAGIGIFYRGTETEDKKKLDKSKAKLSHVGGDSIMSFEVYKHWQAVPEKEKLRWCLENSINNKGIRSVRETVNETVQTLEKEYKIEIHQIYSEEVTLTDMLQKMIFKCYSTNVCHFLGLENYIAGSLHKQVRIHPSSCLHCLASFPEWVVYSHLTKTSRDFITGITPVDESWIVEESAKRIGFNFEEIRNITISNVYTKQLGRHAFFSLVGPGYTNLRRYEEMSEKDVVVVEADRELGEVKVFSTGKMDDDLEKVLEETAESAISDVKLSDWEQALGTDNSGVRVVLGPGGQVIEVLMPEVTRKIYITKQSPGATKESILQKFGRFGEVKFCKQFENGNNWGYLIFKTSRQAEDAACRSRHDKDNAGELERRQPVNFQRDFKARLAWYRKPARGFGFVSVSPNLVNSCLKLESFYVEDQLVTITRNKKRKRQRSFYLQNLTSEMTEKIIKRSLAQALGLNKNESSAIQEVTIVRQHAPKTTQADLEALERLLTQQIERHLKKSTVNVQMKFPESSRSIHFQADATFSHSYEGMKACRKLRNNIFINDQIVAIVPLVSTYLAVDEKMMIASGLDEDSVRDRLAYLGVDVEFTRQCNGNFVICIEGTENEITEKAKDLLNNVFRGEVLDCKAYPEGMCLLTPSGRKFLENIEKNLGNSACILVDSRLKIISFHGNNETQASLHNQIENYLEEQKNSDRTDVPLKGSLRAPGLMKALLIRYGYDLLKLVNKAHLANIDINYYRHKLTLTGSQESILKAKEIITQLEAEIWVLSEKAKPNENTIECVACLCPVETGELHRLEICGHPYCRSCLKLQISVAIASRSLPVICCEERCGQHIAWRDINSLVRRGDIRLPELAQAAVYTYVMSHPNSARFCLTPNCPMVYCVSDVSRAQIFNCSECYIRMCTACHSKAHDGVTCAMQHVEKDVMTWVKQDKAFRKTCPKCCVVIEKNSGCNKMRCIACKTIFCWLCCKEFVTVESCYDHLCKVHGGIGI